MRSGDVRVIGGKAIRKGHEAARSTPYRVSRVRKECKCIERIVWRASVGDIYSLCTSPQVKSRQLSMRSCISANQLRLLESFTSLAIKLLLTNVYLLDIYLQLN